MTDAVARILAERGPLHLDDIERLLREAGEPMPEQPFDLDRPAAELADGRWMWLPTC